MDPQALYRENAARGAGPVRQVILLYERMVEDLRRAADAIVAGDIERRTNCINHALLILAQLQASLDRGAGGEVARILDRFYNVTRRQLVEMQFQQPRTALDDLIKHVLDLCDAWRTVEREQSSQPEHSPNPEHGPSADSGAEHAALNWNA